MKLWQIIKATKDNNKQTSDMFDVTTLKHMQKVTLPKSTKVLVVNGIMGIFFFILTALLFINKTNEAMEISASWAVRSITTEAVKGIFDIIPKKIKKVVGMVLLVTILVMTVIYSIKNSDKILEIIGDSALRGLVFTVTNIVILYIIKLFDENNS